MAERSFIIWEVDKRPVHRDEVKFPRISGRKVALGKILENFDKQQQRTRVFLLRLLLDFPRQILCINFPFLWISFKASSGPLSERLIEWSLRSGRAVTNLHESEVASGVLRRIIESNLPVFCTFSIIWESNTAARHRSRFHLGDSTIGCAVSREPPTRRERSCEAVNRRKKSFSSAFMCDCWLSSGPSKQRCERNLISEKPTRIVQSKKRKSEKKPISAGEEEEENNCAN